MLLEKPTPFPLTLEPLKTEECPKDWELDQLSSAQCQISASEFNRDLRPVVVMARALSGDAWSLSWGGLHTGVPHLACLSLRDMNQGKSLCRGLSSLTVVREGCAGDRNPTQFCGKYSRFRTVGLSA